MMTNFITNINKDFYLAKLETCDCAAILALEAIIFDDLPDIHKSYLSPKSPEAIIRNLSDPHYAIGVFNSSQQLVGTSFLLSYSASAPLYGLTACPAVHKLMYEVEAAGIICTVMVHPNSRKYGLMKSMIKFIKQEASEKGHQFIVTEVAADNTWSRKGFISNDFYSVAYDIDCSDGTHLEFLRTDLNLDTRRPEVPQAKQTPKESIHVIS